MLFKISAKILNKMNEQELNDIVEEIKRDARKSERIKWMSRIAENYLEEQERKKQQDFKFFWFGVFPVATIMGIFLFFKK